MSSVYPSRLERKPSKLAPTNHPLTIPMKGANLGVNSDSDMVKTVVALVEDR
jgi:hypothetical protein